MTTKTQKQEAEVTSVLTRHGTDYYLNIGDFHIPIDETYVEKAKEIALRHNTQPELLEALKKMTDLYGPHVWGFDRITRNQQYWFDRAEQAISAAKGVQS